jgi:uncharacterized protein (TIGR02594 family)
MKLETLNLKLFNPLKLKIMALPQKYNWLLKENGPLMLKEALKLLDVTEDLSKKNNPIIMSWAKELGADVAHVYIADEIPWCGLFMAYIAKKASKQVVKSPLWALNWGNFGQYIPTPMLGDVLVFTRKTPTGKTAGHVALYVGEDSTHYHCLGGNQSDKVCITRIEKDRLYTARRPNYKIKPANVRRILLSNTGTVSTNEQ